MKRWKDIKDNPRDSHGWVLVDGKPYAWIAEGAWIGEGAWIEKCARIGENAWIGERARIGEHAQIGKDAQIAEGAQIGEYAYIGERARIGEGASVKSSVPSVYIHNKWYMSPYRLGEVRLGCYQGDYEALRNRTQADWDKHRYTAENVEMILKTLDYFQAIEYLIFDSAP